MIRRVWFQGSFKIAEKGFFSLFWSKIAQIESKKDTIKLWESFIWNLDADQLDYLLRDSYLRDSNFTRAASGSRVSLA